MGSGSGSGSSSSVMPSASLVSTSLCAHSESQLVAASDTATLIANFNAAMASLSRMMLAVKRRTMTMTLLYALNGVDDRYRGWDTAVKVLNLFEEDTQRPVHLSLIDLNQTRSEDGCDILMQLIKLHSLKMIEPLKRQFDDVVWTRVMELLDINCEDDDDDVDDDENGNSENGSDRHRVGYDVTRRDFAGYTALHHACTVSMSEGCSMYRLAQRLLELGADPNTKHRLDLSLLMDVTSSWWSCESHPDMLLPAIKLLLTYSADINAQTSSSGFTCMAGLLYRHRLDLLRTMYERLPHYMSAVDYSLLGKVGQRWMTLTQLAANQLSNASNEQGREVYNAILTLILTEREKQYADIRHLLHLHTPLRLNQHSDLTAIIFSFIKAKDYEK